MRQFVPLFMPISIALTFIIAGYIAKSKNSKTSNILMLSGILCLFVFSQANVANFLLHSLERRHPPTELHNVLPADVAILLTGGMELPLSPRTNPELGSRGDRLLGAFRLMQAGKAPLLIIAGGNPSNLKMFRSEAENTKDILIDWGIPASKIIIEVASTNTEQSAENLSTMLSDLQARQVILITSAYHMPRAVMHFEEIIETVVPYSTNTLITKKATKKWNQFVPSSTSLDGSTLAIHEYIGMTVEIISRLTR